MIKTSLLAGGLAILASLALTVPASADIAVIGSSNPAAVAIGVLTDNQVLEVPAGESVRIMTPSGRTSVLNGPVMKPVAELAGGDPRDEELWRSVTTSRPGLKTRSINTYKFSWETVPVFKGGDVCVDGDAKLSLLRSSGAKTQRMLVQQLQGERSRFEIVFAEGQRLAPWPDDTPPVTGNYLIQPDGQDSIRVTLRLITPRPSNDDALRVLHGQRCQLQKEALLEALRDPSYVVSALGQ